MTITNNELSQANFFENCIWLEKIEAWEKVEMRISGSSFSAGKLLPPAKSAVTGN